jgi:hypothetical protein|tara:strand:- start:18 stop:197 length:180 start_codon:yes stop_codon:yes gene_type:complete
MKIDKNGLDEIRSKFETPFKALAEQLSDKNCLDHETSEIVTFIFSELAKLGENPWEVID